MGQANHPEKINGNEVVETRQTITGQTVYAVNPDDSPGRMWVNDNGDEINLWDCGTPQNPGLDGWVQTDPDGPKCYTTSESERLLDRAKTVYGVLPSGEITAALTYDTLIAVHYNDEYTDYKETPFKRAFNKYVSGTGASIPIPAGRYYLGGDTEAGHTYGNLEKLEFTHRQIPKRDLADYMSKFESLIREGNIPLTAPVMITPYSILTHEAHVDALRDMLVAEYED